MSVMPSVLVLGETPALLQLSWALSNSNWPVIKWEYSNRNAKQANKGYFIYSKSGLAEFSATELLTGTTELALWLATRTKEKLDYLLLAPGICDESIQKLKSAQKIIGDETIVIVDSSDDPWETFKVEKLFTCNVILAMYSDVESRVLDASSKSYQLVNDCRELILGHNTIKQSSNSKDCLDLSGERGKRLLFLKITYDKAVGQPNSLKIIPSSSLNTLSKALWMKVMAVACIDSMSLIFEEPDVLLLFARVGSFTTLEGAFHEILNLCGKLQRKVLPRENSFESRALFKFLIIVQQNKRLERMSTLRDMNKLPNSIEETEALYDFSKKQRQKTVGIISELLERAKETNVQVPNLKSILNYVAMLTIFRERSKIVGTPHVTQHSTRTAQNQTSNSLALKDNASVKKIHSLNSPLGIGTLVQFPLGCKPLILMSIIQGTSSMRGTSKNNIGNVDNDSDTEHDSLDSQLRELITGREKLTYGEDIFYDADNQNLQPVTPSRAPYNSNQSQEYVLQNTASPQQLHYKNHFYLQPSSNFQSEVSRLSNSNLLNSHGTGSPYSMHRNATNTSSSTIASNGDNSISQSNSLSQANCPGTNSKKKKFFYHVPTPTNKHTSSQKLRDSHANLLELVQFSGLVEHGSSSRYGDVDTSSVVLSSANNSGRSSARSSLTPSRGSTKYDSYVPQSHTESQQSQPQQSSQASQSQLHASSLTGYYEEFRNARNRRNATNWSHRST
ncbi:uncharacterized protein PRCAT00002123001 [Priceomyces carsonii]|uniref:uncharacterized protein n=1 Tax=Priceomyces carsonii TaxID=28549 RepID=UPI002ED8E968|nr:unnamed protein product [Priceomyces carsonii]